MENQLNNNVRRQEQEETTIDIREILFLVLHNWWIFLLSIIVCGGIAFFVAKIQAPTYEESAMILIRDEKAGGASAFEGAALFDDLGMFGKGLVLENEIYVLQSTPLMSKVVDKLNLQVNYQVNTVFKKRDLYGESPIRLTMMNKKGEPNEVSMKVEVLLHGDGTYNYTLEVPKKEMEKSGTAQYGEIVDVDSLNCFSVEETGFFAEEYLDKSIKISVAPIYNRAKALLENLTVTRPDKITGILNLTMKDSNPLRAQRILDTLIAVYNEDAITDKNKIAQNTENFIVNRIHLIYGELEGVDEQVANLMAENQITDAATAANLIATEGMKSNEELNAVEVELAMVQYLQKHLADPSNKDGLLPGGVINDAGVNTLISNYNAQKLEYDKMVNSSGVNNPTTKNLRRSLEDTREAVVRSVDNLVETIKIKRGSLLKREKMTKNKITSTPQQQKELQDVTRQQAIKQELYMYLLKKREENALTLAITESNAKIVEAANGTGIPVAPRTVMYLLVGFVLGFALPLVYMFLWEFFNTKVRSKADVEKALSIPIIGEIPEKGKDREEDYIVVTESGKDIITEAFRILHSNIQFFLQDPSQKVIQMVSSIPGEGKSHTSLNLALSFAFLGKKTIILDLDLRKRSLSKVMDKNKRNGIIQYLIGKEDDINNIITHSQISPNLHYIVCEKTPPNATQLLLTDKYEKLIEKLKETYDYIVVDSTPAQVIADAVIINKVSDLTLYVSRIGVVDKRFLPNIQELYDSNKFKNMAMILTAVPITKKGYGYGYGYGYGDESEAGK